ncbi:bifunctional polysaccharide deacetylase/glycosyltransferase family 2 protein [Actinomycetospora sp. TBRC 11914]|uniref:bifunctional polysaccharide deacetylase/glycosyltransferase family 2 protein n=1 Tax=Actinomycetospora sp. TBRC 11914 TaxID=2729387 RepID=UPI002899B251|nr:bifunctional polysaccharide deacetylase/glycosyltransferase family 2 protein [Actinomycetospora sp. TBRC 11914]
MARHSAAPSRAGWRARPASSGPRGPRRRRWLPRPGVVLVVVALVMFGCLLLVNGLAHSEVGVDAEGGKVTDTTNMDEVPRSVTDGGPVLDTRGAEPRSAAMPAKTIALTFDDGPDPTWTPQILAVLAKHHVPATFFVVGSRAASNPGLLRQIRAAGSEVGIHTFTHPDLGQVSTLRIDRELAETQLVVNGATGQTSYLLRPPYSSTANAVDNDALRSFRETGADGYVTVLSDVDSRDWERPGVDAIVRNAQPAGTAGAIVLLHDAGGERSQTVAALDRLIPDLQARGYRFTTPEAAVGLPADNQPASAPAHAMGATMIGLVAVAGGVVDALAWLLLVVGVLVVVRLALMLAVACRQHRRRHRPGFSWGPTVRAPVSVVVPAYNEKENIAATVRSLVASEHPVEVLVVDDGSTDGTADIVEALRLPNVRVLRQANGGKPSALNAGIAHARHDLIVMIDGDTVFEPATVGRLVQPFADPSVGAVAGNAKVAAPTRLGFWAGLVSRWQHIEYVMGFNVDRRVYDVLRCMPTIPGAIGAFRRAVLLEVGGVSHDTLAEDTDLTMAICRTGWRVVYEDSARAWTEAPGTLPQLWRQRYRWSYGTMQAMWKHRRAVLDRGASGRFGRLGLAHLAVFQILLPLLAPLVDIFLVYGLVFLNPVTTLLLWAAVLAIQVLAAVVAFRLEREPLRVLWLLPLQQVVYRQLMYAVLIRSTVTALGGIRLGWQKLRRVGGLDALLAAPPDGHAAGPLAPRRDGAGHDRARGDALEPAGVREPLDDRP